MSEGNFSESDESKCEIFIPYSFSWSDSKFDLQI